MKKNVLVIAIVAVVVAVGVAAFFGGMQLSGTKRLGGLAGQNFQNFGNSNTNRARNGQAGSGFVNGDVIAKDNNSITVKLRDGGSKIIFYSSATEIGKFVNGTSSDLEIGKTVMITGTANPDGSVTAQSVQIRPQTRTSTQVQP